MTLVIFQFLFPKILVFIRCMFLTSVAVPKAAVDEDGDLFLEEDEVGVAFDVVVAAPAGDAVLLEDLDKL